MIFKGVFAIEIMNESDKRDTKIYQFFKTQNIPFKAF